MKPLIYALHDQLPQIQWNHNTTQIVNQADILANITRNYGLDPTLIKNIQIVSVSGGLHFGVHDTPLTELLSPFMEEQELARLQRDYFPQCTTEQLFAVLYGITCMIASTRLDIRTDIVQPDDSHWYFSKTEHGLTANRQYFYEAIRSYINTGQKAKLAFCYLCATSSSPSGGLTTVAYFDVEKREDVYEIVLPATQFTYADILQILVHEPNIRRTIQQNLWHNCPSSTKQIQAGLLLLEQLWASFCFKTVASVLPNVLFGWEETLVTQQQFEQQTWNMVKRQYIDNCIFDSCTFYRVAMNSYTEDDFVYCTFIECDFTGIKLAPEPFQGLFPILRCTFIRCKNIPKDPMFQYKIKNCTFIY